MRYLKILTLIALLLTTTVEARPHDDQRYHNAAQHAYDRGYQDGCTTARHHYIRDRRAYKNNRSYRHGWRDGKLKCERRRHRDDRYSGDHRKDNHASRRAYDRGYQDGCTTARHHFIRDRRAYNNNQNYRRGWRDGKLKCERRRR